MNTDIENPRDVSFTEIFRDISANAQQLIAEESRLIKTEFAATVRNVGSDLRDLIIFGALTILAALPLMMFLIFGLGELLNGRYWLSSLLVAMVWGGGAGFLAYRQYSQLIKKKPSLSATRKTLGRATETVKESVGEVKDAIEQTLQ